MDRFRALLAKELGELVRNRVVLGTLVAAPTLLTLVAIGSLVPLLSVPVEDIGPDDLAALGNAVDCADLDGPRCLQLSLASLHRLLFFVVPTVLPTTIAAHAIVGEKTERTLEALLATPLTTAELVLAKAVAAVAPSLAATWLGASLHAAALAALVGPALVGRVYGPTWLAGLAVTAPLLALASTLGSMLVSARSVDPRSAQQIGGLVVVPVVGMLVAQALGMGVISAPVLGALTVALAFGDVLLAWTTVALFEREAILTRWTGL